MSTSNALPFLAEGILTDARESGVYFGERKVFLGTIPGVDLKDPEWPPAVRGPAPGRAAQVCPRRPGRGDGSRAGRNERVAARRHHLPLPAGGLRQAARPRSRPAPTERRRSRSRGARPSAPDRPAPPRRPPERMPACRRSPRAARPGAAPGAMTAGTATLRWVTVWTVTIGHVVRRDIS